MTVKVFKGLGAEFWRIQPPIVNSFKADTRPEVCIADTATEDRGYRLPFPGAAVVDALYC